MTTNLTSSPEHKLYGIGPQNGRNAKTGDAVYLPDGMVKHIAKRRLRRALAFASADVYHKPNVYATKTWLLVKQRHTYLSLMTSLYDVEYKNEEL